MIHESNQLSKELEKLSELPMQGRLVGNQGADYLMSQNIFRNYKLSDDLISFWYKARHDVLPCYYTLSLLVGLERDKIAQKVIKA